MVSFFFCVIFVVVFPSACAMVLLSVRAELVPKANRVERDQRQLLCAAVGLMLITLFIIRYDDDDDDMI